MVGCVAAVRAPNRREADVIPPLLVAQFRLPSADGHGRYRVHGPGAALARLPGVTVVECDPSFRWAGWLADHADVLVLHGVGPELLPVAARRRAGGRVTTLDASDHHFDVQVWNPNVAGWLDRTVHDQFWQLAAAVDAVQTSTEPLAELWRPAARRVAVFDNGLEDVPPLESPTGRPFTVGWAGSVTHLPDWFRTAPVLEKWVRDRPGSRLAVMTDARAEGFVRLPPDRYAFRPAGTWDEYRAFLRELDAGVVPLTASPFNRGRTDLKFLEYAAHGVVAVCADVPPYRGAVAPGETGFLYRDDPELVAHLDRLAADAALRDRVRRAAHAFAGTRPAAAAAERRRDFYLGLLGGRTPAPELPAELVREAVADGRHLCVVPGEPERLLRAAQARPADPGLAAEVAALAARHPDWPDAARLAARLWNDLGRPADARAVLGPLLSRRPDSPGAWAEAARAHVGLGDLEGARYCLGRALAANPAHPAAWALALRHVGADPDRYAAAHPHSYAAALAGDERLAPADRAARIAEALDRFLPGLNAAERPQAAEAFGRAASSLDVSELDLLRRLAAAFPESARIADRYGQALWAAGDAAGAEAEFARAAGLARVARTFQLEAGEVAGREFVWAVCEYLRRHDPSP